MPMIARLWHRAFLAPRPSISLSLFRFAVAFTVGAHMIPSFFQMKDNYLATAFKTQNPHFFPVPILEAAARSPDGLVWTLVGLFAVSLAAFTVGLYTQLSAILLTLTCYYFYALNNYHIGTLSFDILLVTLFLVCIAKYPGDGLSLDSVRRGKPQSYRRLRPFFQQRLLQLQLAWTFWGTALSKFTAGGNWLTDNPYYYLLHSPAGGVVRDFPLRRWLAGQPELCYGLGVLLIACELSLPCLWFIPRTRLWGLALGAAFQIMLWVTLHVPTIFLFLFPPLMLLFIPPEHLVAWIETRRARIASGPRGLLVYDGRCGFCLESVKRLQALDLFGWVELADYHEAGDLQRLHPELTAERCRSEMVLVEPGGRLSGGFHAFRRLTARLVLLWPLWPFVRLPGAAWVGTRAYRWIAEHRYLLHHNPACTVNNCVH